MLMEASCNHIQNKNPTSTRAQNNQGILSRNGRYVLISRQDFLNNSKRGVEDLFWFEFKVFFSQ